MNPPNGITGTGSSKITPAQYCGSKLGFEQLEDPQFYTTDDNLPINFNPTNHAPVCKQDQNSCYADSKDLEVLKNWKGGIVGTLDIMTRLYDGNIPLKLNPADVVAVVNKYAGMSSGSTEISKATAQKVLCQPELRLLIRLELDRKSGIGRNPLPEGTLPPDNVKEIKVTFAMRTAMQQAVTKFYGQSAYTDRLVEALLNGLKDGSLGFHLHDYKDEQTGQKTEGFTLLLTSGGNTSQVARYTKTTFASFVEQNVETNVTSRDDLSKMLITYYQISLVAGGTGYSPGKVTYGSFDTDTAEAFLGLLGSDLNIATFNMDSVNILLAAKHKALLTQQAIVTGLFKRASGGPLMETLRFQETNRYLGQIIELKDQAQNYLDGIPKTDAPELESQSAKDLRALARDVIADCEEQEVSAYSRFLGLGKGQDDLLETEMVVLTQKIERYKNPDDAKKLAKYKTAVRDAYTALFQTLARYYKATNSLEVRAKIYNHLVDLHALRAQYPEIDFPYFGSVDNAGFAQSFPGVRGKKIWDTLLKQGLIVLDKSGIYRAGNKFTGDRAQFENTFQIPLLTLTTQEKQHIYDFLKQAIVSADIKYVQQKVQSAGERQAEFSDLGVEPVLDESKVGATVDTALAVSEFLDKDPDIQKVPELRMIVISYLDRTMKRRTEIDPALVIRKFLAVFDGDHHASAAYAKALYEHNLIESRGGMVNQVMYDMTGKSINTGIYEQKISRECPSNDLTSPKMKQLGSSVNNLAVSLYSAVQTHNLVHPDRQIDFVVLAKKMQQLLDKYENPAARAIFRKSLGLLNKYDGTHAQAEFQIGEWAQEQLAKHFTISHPRLSVKGVRHIGPSVVYRLAYRAGAKSIRTAAVPYSSIVAQFEPADLTRLAAPKDPQNAYYLIMSSVTGDGYYFQRVNPFDQTAAFPIEKFAHLNGDHRAHGIANLMKMAPLAAFSFMVEGHVDTDAPISTLLADKKLSNLFGGTGLKGLVEFFSQGKYYTIENGAFSAFDQWQRDAFKKFVELQQGLGQYVVENQNDRELLLRILRPDARFTEQERLRLVGWGGEGGLLSQLESLYYAFMAKAEARSKGQFPGTENELDSDEKKYLAGALEEIGAAMGLRLLGCAENKRIFQLRRKGGMRGDQQQTLLQLADYFDRYQIYLPDFRLSGLKAEGLKNRFLEQIPTNRMARVAISQFGANQQAIWTSLIRAGYVDEQGLFLAAFDGKWENFKLDLKLTDQERAGVFTVLKKGFNDRAAFELEWKEFAKTYDQSLSLLRRMHLQLQVLADTFKPEEHDKFYGIPGLSLYMSTLGHMWKAGWEALDPPSAISNVVTGLEDSQNYEFALALDETLRPELHGYNKGIDQETTTIEQHLAFAGKPEQKDALSYRNDMAKIEEDLDNLAATGKKKSHQQVLAELLQHNKTVDALANAILGPESKLQLKAFHSQYLQLRLHFLRLKIYQMIVNYNEFIANVDWRHPDPDFAFKDTRSTYFVSVAGQIESLLQSLDQGMESADQLALGLGSLQASVANLQAYLGPQPKFDFSFNGQKLLANQMRTELAATLKLLGSLKSSPLFQAFETRSKLVGQRGRLMAYIANFRLNAESWSALKKKFQMHFGNDWKAGLARGISKVFTQDENKFQWKTGETFQGDMFEFLDGFFAKEGGSINLRNLIVTVGDTDDVFLAKQMLSKLLTTMFRSQEVNWFSIIPTVVGASQSSMAQFTPDVVREGLNFLGLTGFGDGRVGADDLDRLVQYTQNPHYWVGYNAVTAWSMSANQKPVMDQTGQIIMTNAYTQEGQVYLAKKLGNSKKDKFALNKVDGHDVRFFYNKALQDTIVPAVLANDFVRDKIMTLTGQNNGWTGGFFNAVKSGKYKTDLLKSSRHDMFQEPWLSIMKEKWRTSQVIGFLKSVEGLSPAVRKQATAFISDEANRPALEAGVVAAWEKVAKIIPKDYHEALVHAWKNPNKATSARITKKYFHKRLESFYDVKDFKLFSANKYSPSSQGDEFFFAGVVQDAGQIIGAINTSKQRHDLERDELMGFRAQDKWADLTYRFKDDQQHTFVVVTPNLADVNKPAAGTTPAWYARAWNAALGSHETVSNLKYAFVGGTDNSSALNPFDRDNNASDAWAKIQRTLIRLNEDLQSGTLDPVSLSFFERTLPSLVRHLINLRILMPKGIALGYVDLWGSVPKILATLEHMLTLKDPLLRENMKKVLVEHVQTLFKALGHIGGAFLVYEGLPLIFLKQALDALENGDYETFAASLMATLSFARSQTAVFSELVQNGTIVLARSRVGRTAVSRLRSGANALINGPSGGRLIRVRGFMYRVLKPLQFQAAMEHLADKTEDLAERNISYRSAATAWQHLRHNWSHGTGFRVAKNVILAAAPTRSNTFYRAGKAVKGFFFGRIDQLAPGVRIQSTGDGNGEQLHGETTGERVTRRGQRLRRAIDRLRRRLAGRITNLGEFGNGEQLRGETTGERVTRRGQQLRRAIDYPGLGVNWLRRQLADRIINLAARLPQSWSIGANSRTAQGNRVTRRANRQAADAILGALARGRGYFDSITIHLASGPVIINGYQAARIVNQQPVGGLTDVEQTLVRERLIGSQKNPSQGPYARRQARLNHHLQNITRNLDRLPGATVLVEDMVAAGVERARAEIVVSNINRIGNPMHQSGFNLAASIHNMSRSQWQTHVANHGLSGQEAGQIRRWASDCYHRRLRGGTFIGLFVGLYGSMKLTEWCNELKLPQIATEAITIYGGQVLTVAAQNMGRLARGVQTADLLTALTSAGLRGVGRTLFVRPGLTALAGFGAEGVVGGGFALFGSMFGYHGLENTKLAKGVGLGAGLGISFVPVTATSLSGGLLAFAAPPALLGAITEIGMRIRYGQSWEYVEHSLVEGSAMFRQEYPFWSLPGRIMGSIPLANLPFQVWESSQLYVEPVAKNQRERLDQATEHFRLALGQTATKALKEIVIKRDLDIYNPEVVDELKTAVTKRMLIMLRDPQYKPMLDQINIYMKSGGIKADLPKDFTRLRAIAAYALLPEDERYLVDQEQKQQDRSKRGSAPTKTPSHSYGYYLPSQEVLDWIWDNGLIQYVGPDGQPKLVQWREPLIQARKAVGLK
ncbi:hypothetical protein A2291_08100 [candidate division WOR-1 bacterium RIFOXYB2_FULL_42_35]|uniref:Uncharacterized protein n=1 Tax=candidate division WOR-1 bacterium RIFOXYC2_FULL_41_25 TaxID=1802586 RepID=A0A1F4TIC5_UNCSA|nr:MAG: hypothetical protein A2247_01940 [candidate division WOR-1 bacterium RIFOXYA2_FULL_41_14]OGC24049.1 MAG: hypothetical protein A2291_08100 [candidate division WOR-1 bacterium RIFOXYB2_FULL_42_35]OGC32472.1 MAG: hypothetical protein A2462_00200 [candidate division WOR-1 bacterium RIFOXYC2_FULL_41_25]